ncbi:MAG: DUF4340 domain-containing protein [Chloroflexi bacterium]|nr:DUF4340 domain-containing protein [Chloroflexota bacterium]
MIRRETWALLAVFAVLLAIALGFRQRQQTLPARETGTLEPTPTPLPPLFDVDPDALAVRVVLEEPIGEQRRVVLERVATPTPTPESPPTPATPSEEATPTPTPQPMWAVVEPEGATPPQDWEIESAIQSLISARALAVLPEDQTDPQALGLVKPHRVIEVTFADGQRIQLLVGIMTPLQNGYYVQTEPDGPVYVVSDFLVDGVWDLLTQVYASLATPTPSPTSESAGF